MKHYIRILIIILLPVALKAQTVLNINENSVLGPGQWGNQFNNYVINIKDGITLTINNDVYFSNVTINGGNVEVHKRLTYWAPGTFNNVNVTFRSNGSLVTAGSMKLDNSEFTFLGSSSAIIYTSMELISSKIVLDDRSSLEMTSGTFSMKNNSKVVVGNGTVNSTAYIRFNGGNVYEYDNSYITIANYNNYYFNWQSYRAVAYNRNINTLNNNLNCNAPGKNNCSAPNVYGPSTLAPAGLSSAAMLPVKLSAFGVKSVSNTAEITWTTDAEINASHFEIERSTDGQQFAKVGTVKSNVNTNYVSTYSFNDVLKISGKYYYRLKMVDQDGSFEYSPIRAINAVGTLTMNVYPNPTTDYFVIQTANNTEKLNIEIYNLNGQVVKRQSGNANTVVSVGNLVQGTYVVKVNGQSLKLVKK